MIIPSIEGRKKLLYYETLYNILISLIALIIMLLFEHNYYSYNFIIHTQTTELKKLIWERTAKLYFYYTVHVDEHPSARFMDLLDHGVIFFK